MENRIIKGASIGLLPCEISMLVGEQINMTPEWLKNFNVKSFLKRMKRSGFLKKYRSRNFESRIKDSMIANVKHFLKQNKINQKINHSNIEKILGYSIKQLINHLISFGFDSVDYGYNGWVIDHIKPKSLFKCRGVESIEFRNCWCLENLQPLLHYDNICKGNKFSVMEDLNGL